MWSIRLVFQLSRRVVVLYRLVRRRNVLRRKCSHTVLCKVSVQAIALSYNLDLGLEEDGGKINGICGAVEYKRQIYYLVYTSLQHKMFAEREHASIEELHLARDVSLSIKIAGVV